MANNGSSFVVGPLCYGEVSRKEGSMGLLDDAMDRTTGTHGQTPDVLQRHTHSFEVPAGTGAPGVFVAMTEEGEEEVGFWLTLRTLAQKQEMAIINRGLPKGRRGQISADFQRELIKAAMWLFHDELPVQLGGHDAGEELTRAKREWLWNALDQRGRNLVSYEYDVLTEPTAPDPENPGNE